MDFYDVVANRHSVRGFRPDAVSEDVLRRMIAAAEMAPSAMNSQPWRFHVCTGNARVEVGRIMAQSTAHLNEYLEVFGQEAYDHAVRWYSTFGDAPVLIVVSAAVGEGERERTDVLLSIGCAVENLQLAAVAEGVGSCNVTSSWWVADELREHLGLAEDRTIACVVAVGHPSPDADPVLGRRVDDTEWLS